MEKQAVQMQEAVSKAERETCASGACDSQSEGVT